MQQDIGREKMPYVTEANLTDIALDRWSNIPDERLRKIMAAAVKHVHAFVREVEPTKDEWFAAVDWLTRIGQKSDDKRQEMILLSDVLGVSMLVDAINNRLPSGATPSTVEGPFHIAGTPEIENGKNVTEGAPGIPCIVTGKIADLHGKPIAGAAIDMWQTDGDGLYEAQRELDHPYMRGIYRSQPDGSFIARTVAPIGYSIPMDGPVGALMNKTTISHFRPAHIHFAVDAPGYHGVVTHLFQAGDEFIDTDVVYGVKKELIVEFKQKPAGTAINGEEIKTPYYEVNYDFVLQKLESAKAAA
jgi:hydroxyquinol 1,2-dioxygenase